ncbi:MAG TPA: ankyrin repeat domain-containing protein, partial [Candidatus Babeliales bacterium]|nr:ankyrin repeat domain-containing protein [Candidatus Babeliales bacterium]
MNNNKKNFITATHIDICNIKADLVMDLSLDHVYQEVNSLFLAHDIDLIVKSMSQFKYNFAYNLIEKMIDDETVCLSPEEKVKIIYGMITHSCPKKNVQYEWLDLLLKHPSLHAQTPVLLSLARSKYADVIALFIAWGKDRQKVEGRNGLLAGYAEQAFKAAVEDDDYAAVETLFSKKIRIAQPKASELLWYIVENGKNSKLISLLVSHAQADVNSADNGKTLLIVAVEKNNTDIVRVLLDEGAVVDRIVDNEAGTALTIAMKHKHHSVEQLLR